MKGKILLWILIIIIFCNVTYGTSLKTDNLVYLAFDDVGVVDYDMYGVTDSIGKIDRALYFDGTNDYVEGSFDLNNGGFTLNAWINLTDTSGSNQIINTDSAAARSFQFRIDDTTGYLRLIIFIGGSNYQVISTGDSLFDDWHMVTATYDGSEAKIYVDGVLNGSDSSMSGDINDNPDFRIGMSVRGTDPSEGSIDDVRVYNESFNSTQILELYNSGSGTEAETIAPTTLAFHADMNSLKDETATVNIVANNGITETTGKVGDGAVSFDGVDDYIDTNYNLTGITGNTLTYSAWFKNNDTRINIIMSTISASPTFQGHEIYIHDGILKFFIGNDVDTGNYNLLTSPLSYNDNQWHHVVSVYNNSYNASDMNIYVDGSPIVPVISKNDLTATPFGTENVTIGIRPTLQGAYWFNGTLDEVAVYNHVLNSSQIAILYNDGEGYNPYTGIINITINSPANNTYINDRLSTNFSYVNNLGEPGVCSLYINDTLVNTSQTQYCYQENAFDTSTSCYQESTNTSDQTGIDGTCGLDYSGSYTFVNSGDFNNPLNAIDGNWGTAATTGWDSGKIYMNYTKPSLATSANWRLNIGNNGERNETILDSCFDYYDDYIYLYLYSYDSPSTERARAYCFNGSWQQLFGDENDEKLYEEGIYWNFEDQTTNDGDCGLNYSGSYVFDSIGYNGYNLNITYSIPEIIDSIYLTKWQVKIGDSGADPFTINISIPEHCMISSDLKLRIYTASSGQARSKYYCFNGSDWEELYDTGEDGTYFFPSGSASPDLIYDGDWSTNARRTLGQWVSNGPDYMSVYEEAVYWSHGILNGTNTILSSSSQLSEGSNEWYVNCSSTSIDPTTTGTYNVYYDVTEPIIISNFVNDSLNFDYSDNLTANFTFTDNILLNSVNITVDGIYPIYFATGINATTFGYNLSLKGAAYPAGKRIVSVELSDGHTREELKSAKDYNPKYDILHEELEYDIKGKYDKTTLTMKRKFEKDRSDKRDKWSTKEYKDRLSETYETDNPSSEMTFVIESDKKINLLEDPQGRFGGKWLTMGDHWKDFVVIGEPNITREFKKINDNKYEVTLSNIKNPDKMVFNSTGDLNIVTSNFTFYSFNFSSGSSWTTEANIYDGNFSTSSGTTNTSFLKSNYSDPGYNYGVASTLWETKDSVEGTVNRTLSSQCVKTPLRLLTLLDEGNLRYYGCMNSSSQYVEIYKNFTGNVGVTFSEEAINWRIE